MVEHSRLKQAFVDHKCQFIFNGFFDGKLASAVVSITEHWVLFSLHQTPDVLLNFGFSGAFSHRLHSYLPGENSHNQACSKQESTLYDFMHHL